MRRIDERGDFFDRLSKTDFILNQLHVGLGITQFAPKLPPIITE